jgi:hypothetical protein
MHCIAVALQCRRSPALLMHSRFAMYMYAMYALYKRYRISNPSPRAGALPACRKPEGRRAAAVDELVEIAECVGGPGLAGVCRLLAQDHAGWAGAHNAPPAPARRRRAHGAPHLLVLQGGRQVAPQPRLGVRWPNVGQGRHARRSPRAWSAPRPRRSEADRCARQAGCRTCCCGGAACQRGPQARRGCQRCGKQCLNALRRCRGRGPGVCFETGCRRDCPSFSARRSSSARCRVHCNSAIAMSSGDRVECTWGTLRAQVKGPRDRLSEQQRAWLAALAAAGLQVEVLKVRASRIWQVCQPLLRQLVISRTGQVLGQQRHGWCEGAVAHATCKSCYGGMAGTLESHVQTHVMLFAQYFKRC